MSKNDTPDKICYVRYTVCCERKNLKHRYRNRCIP